MDLSAQVLIPMGFSFFSLLISSYVLWATRLAPFKLEVVFTGRVQFLRTPPPNCLQRISIQLLFVNKGARHGYVDHVALAVHTGVDLTKPGELYVALFEDVVDANFAEERQNNPHWVAFSSFHLAPGEATVKRIVFLPNQSGTKLLTKVGNCWLTPYTINVGKQNWKRWKSHAVTFNDETVRILSCVQDHPSSGGVVDSKLHSLPLMQRVNSVKNLENRLTRSKGKISWLKLFSRLS